MADFNVPNKIQPREYSRGGGKEDFLRDFGVLGAVNVNWNGDGWNVNAYELENEWNAGIEF